MCRILYNLYLPFVGLYESFSINDCYDSLIAILLLFTELSDIYILFVLELTVIGITPLLISDAADLSLGIIKTHCLLVWNDL